MSFAEPAVHWSASGSIPAAQDSGMRPNCEGSCETFSVRRAAKPPHLQTPPS
jgi:hypothetical protein